MSRLFTLSRPRFWMYVFGPYIVGALVGAATPRDYINFQTLAWALFFLWPANVLIYGINDIFDYETDVLNAKKRGYEALVPPDERLRIAGWVALLCVPFMPLLAFVPRACWGAMAAFLFFSVFYSAPPIRAKAKPILDSAFNVLYICPGAFGYFLTGGKDFSWPLFGAAWAWAMAMHAYSAVPDITADREAAVPTVATLLGLRGTLVFCLLLYLGAALVAFSVLSWLAVMLGLTYTLLMTLSLRAGTENGVMRLYRVFPLVNTVAGGAIWWFIVLHKSSFLPF